MTHPDIKPTNVVSVLGVPFDAYSSFLKGPAKAPSVFFDLLSNGSANSSTELGIDLKKHPHIEFIESITWLEDDQAFAVIENTVSQIVEGGRKPLVIGGDHSITYPVLKGVAAKHDNVTILHFDAHPDLYDEFKGNRYSHACPFARIMESNLASRLVQVGIRTLNAHQREQAQRFNVEVHEMRHWQGPEQLDIKEPVYISIDIDALDTAFAPGVSHLEPGGMSVRQILDVIHSLDVPIIGADIVELNPTRDINNMTAMVAIKLYKELCGKMLG